MPVQFAYGNQLPDVHKNLREHAPDDHSGLLQYLADTVLENRVLVGERRLR